MHTAGDQDEAFTAGVLHNIGRLALDQHRPEALQAARRRAAECGVMVHQAERALFGFSDADLGAGLATHWNLPAELVDAVARQDLDLDQLPAGDSLAGCLVRARIFARAQGLTDGVEPLRHEIPANEWTVPPIASALLRAGGWEGNGERADAFVDAAIAR